jgi:hypothetical protein
MERPVANVSRANVKIEGDSEWRKDEKSLQNSGYIPKFKRLWSSLGTSSEHSTIFGRTIRNYEVYIAKNILRGVFWNLSWSNPVYPATRGKLMGQYKILQKLNQN